MYAYAYRRTGSVEEAKDTVAETYLVAWEKIGSVPSMDLPWLLAVARNILANANRKRLSDREKARRLARSFLSTPHPSDRLEALEERESFVQAFAQLAEEEQEALMLVNWDGLSQTDAAQAYGCTAPAFRLRLHRARKKLARLMREESLVENRQELEPEESS